MQGCLYLYVQYIVMVFKVCCIVQGVLEYVNVDSAKCAVCKLWIVWCILPCLVWPECQLVTPA